MKPKQKEKQPERYGRQRSKVFILGAEATKKEAAQKIWETAVTTEFTTLKGGTETMLLAEDELSIRKFTKNVLERFGYKVIDAFDGEDAINKFRDNKDKIQLLILDVGMPKKNGTDSYKEIKNIRPDIKVIFISGYNADILHRKGVFEKGLNFIPKPFLPTELLRKVREVLDK